MTPREVIGWLVVAVVALLLVYLVLHLVGASV